MAAKFGCVSGACEIYHFLSSMVWIGSVVDLSASEGGGYCVLAG